MRMRRTKTRTKVGKNTCEPLHNKLKRYLATLATFSMIMQPISAFASKIEGGGAFAPEINNDNGIYDITSNHFKDGNAFNSFAWFQLSQDNIANLNMKDASKLFNFVNSQIDVSGTVNTLQNGKIGGNVYFLSKDGMVVNSTGSINTGSLTMIQTNDAMMNKVFGQDITATEKLMGELSTQITTKGAVPIGDGEIIIKGCINTTNDINALGAAIKLEGAKLYTGIVDFSDVVNLSDLPEGTKVSNLQIDTNGGKITLQAGSREHKEANIIIEKDSLLNAKDNVTISAEAHAEGIDKSKATILLDESSRIQSGKDVDIRAESFYKDDKQGVFDELPTSVKGTLNVLGLDPEDLTGLDVGVVVSSNNADVTVLGDIEAEGNIDLAAKSVTETSLEVDSSTNILVHVVDNDASLEVGGKLSGNNINLSSEAETTIKNKVDAKGQEYTLGLGVTDGETKSNISINDGAKLNAKENITIKSETTNTISSSVDSTIKGTSGTAAVALNIVNYKSSADVDINGDLETKNGNVNIDAQNKITKNNISAETIVDQSVGNVNNNNNQSVFDKIKGTISNYGQDASTEEAQDYAVGDKGAEQSTSAFAGAGALLVANETNSANISIGGNIESSGRIDIDAKIDVEDTFMQAKSGAIGSDNSKVTASGAVLVSNMKNDALVEIKDQTNLKGQGIQINSSVDMDVQRYKKLWEALNELKNTIEDDAEKEKINQLLEKIIHLDIDSLTNDEFVSELQLLGDTLKDNMDILKEFMDIGAFANYSAQSTAKDKSSGLALSGAGTVSVNTLKNNSQISLGNNVKLDAQNNDLNLDATTISKVWNLGGMLGKNPLKSGVDSGGIALGGTYTQQNLDTLASVTVGKQNEIKGKNINFKADNDTLNVSAALGSGKGATGAITGMVSVSNGDSHAKVEVLEGSKIFALDDFNVNSDNTTNVTNIAGGFAQSSGVAVGIGIAINDYDVKNQVVIGENDKEKVTISADNVYTTANTDGMINAISVAGGLAKNSEGEEDEEGSTNSQGRSGGVLNQLKNIGSKVKNLQGVLDGDISGITDLFDTDENGNSQVTDQMNTAPEEQRPGYDVNGESAGTSELVGSADTKQVFLL